MKKQSMPNRMIMSLLVGLSMLYCVNHAIAQPEGLHKGAPAKYVFLFIGDGLGIPHRQLPEIYVAAESGQSFNPNAVKKMAMNTLPSQGVTTTYANNRFIVGSAASATAMSTGFITDIGVIGMDPEMKPLKTVAEMARDKGMRVGIVSSVSIDHATPAAFYAHQPARSMYHEIAHDLANSGFDYFGGGGIKDPQGKRSKAPKGCALELAKANGYVIAATRDAILGLKPGQKAIAYNENLPDGDALPYHMDSKEKDVTLPEFVAKGVELLDNPKGFFMMVESGKIDWASHANDAAATIHDTIAFDEAVKVALKFYEQHPEDTLIVVTGDHECGGLTLGFAGTKYATSYDVLKNQKISFKVFENMVVDYRANTKVPAFADMIPIIEENFGLKFSGEGPMRLKEHEVKDLEDAFVRSMAQVKVVPDGEAYLLYGTYEPLVVKTTHILNNKVGVAWTSYSHTGAPVVTSAIGVGHQLFNGYYHQIDLGQKVMSTLGFSRHYLATSDSPREARFASAGK